MSDFRDKFEAYGGDYEDTMKRFMGSEPTYLRILKMLLQDENMGKLEQALAEGDLAAGFEAAHTLKGVSANLGLTPLCRSVCRIVEPLREGEQRGDYLQMYQEIVQEFARVLELQQRLEEGE